VYCWETVNQSFQTISSNVTITTVSLTETRDTLVSLYPDANSSLRLVSVIGTLAIAMAKAVMQFIFEINAQNWQNCS
jgi:hypothetical protein